MNESMESSLGSGGAARGKFAENKWVTDTEAAAARKAGDMKKIAPKSEQDEVSLSESNIDTKAEARAIAQAEIDGLDAQIEGIQQEIALATAERAMITAELRPLTAMIDDAEAGNDASQTGEMLAKQKELRAAFASEQNMITQGKQQLALTQSERKRKQAQFDTVYPKTLN